MAWSPANAFPRKVRAACRSEQVKPMSEKRRNPGPLPVRRTVGMWPMNKGPDFSIKDYVPRRLQTRPRFFIVDPNENDDRICLATIAAISGTA